MFEKAEFGGKIAQKSEKLLRKNRNRKVQNDQCLSRQNEYLGQSAWRDLHETRGPDNRDLGGGSDPTTRVRRIAKFYNDFEAMARPIYAVRCQAVLNPGFFSNAHSCLGGTLPGTLEGELCRRIDNQQGSSALSRLPVRSLPWEPILVGLADAQKAWLIVGRNLAPFLKPSLQKG
jgi:hypothetical protein